MNSNLIKKKLHTIHNNPKFLKQRIKRFCMRLLMTTLQFAPLKHIVISLNWTPIISFKRTTEFKDIAKEVIPCAPSSLSVVSPALVEAQTDKIESRSDARFAYLIESCNVFPHSNAVIKNKNFAIPGYYLKNENATTIEAGRLLGYNQSIGLLRKSKFANYHKKGLMLCVQGAQNWYHWLIEGMPAAWLSQTLSPSIRRLPLVISEEMSQIKSIMESLELFRDGRELITLPPGNYNFDSIVRIDSIVDEPINCEGWPSAADYKFNQPLILEYRQAILERLNLNAYSGPDKIFLARTSSRRPYNQSNLIEIAEQFGYTVVYPETLDFKEQVQLFQNASYIIGPSGAAFANTLFCRPGTQILSWLPRQMRNFCSFSNIAAANRCRFEFIFTDFDSTLLSTFDTYQSTLHLDEKAFITALRRSHDG